MIGVFKSHPGGAGYDSASGLCTIDHLRRIAGRNIGHRQRTNKLICLDLWAPADSDAAELTIRLQTDLRVTDVASRLDGGHFAVVLVNTPVNGGQAVLARLTRLRGVSGGMAWAPDDGTTFDELLVRAKDRGVQVLSDEQAQLNTTRGLVE